MIIAKTLLDLRAARAACGPVGLVPTMGALHDGHLSLVAAAKATGKPVAVSIFVNPTQFGPNEDFAHYPRDAAGDLAKLKDAGCNLVWLPSTDIMYPPHSATTIQVGGPSGLWEGASRPGHFSGVATAIAKLFCQVKPDAAYFGEKDWQQVQVVSRMVADLHLPVRIVSTPTIREPSGLALSSRNAYLTTEERKTAPLLYATLLHTAQKISAGQKVDPALRIAHHKITGAGIMPDYIALVHATTLEPISRLIQPARLIAAAQLGRVRLLDNLPVG